VVDADDALGDDDDADDAVELGDTEFVAGDRDLQFPAVAMVTTDLLVGMLLDVDGVDGDDGNGVDFLVCLVVASASGVLEFPRFFLCSFCATRTRSTRERELGDVELGGEVGEEVEEGVVTVARSRRLTLDTRPAFTTES